MRPVLPVICQPVVSWIYYLVVVIMPTAVFGVASFTSSGSSPVSLTRSVELAIVISYTIVYISYVFLFIIVQIQTVHDINSNDGKTPGQVIKNMIAARYEATVSAFCYCLVDFKWMSDICFIIPELFCKPQEADESRETDPIQAPAGPVSEATYTRGSRSLGAQSHSLDAVFLPESSSPPTEQGMFRINPLYRDASADADSEMLTELAQHMSAHMDFFVQHNGDNCNSMIIEQLNPMAEQDPMRNLVPSSHGDVGNEAHPDLEPEELQSLNLPEEKSVNAGYLNAEAFDIFFMCCIQLTHVLPAIGNQVLTCR